jgi:hypothetical protein
MKIQILRCSLLFVCLISTVMFFGCKNSLLEPPVLTNADSVSSTLCTEPLNLVSSQGHKQSITLSWDAQLNAVRYYIYSSPLNSEIESDYTRIGELNSTTPTYTFTVCSGNDCYYKVSAINAAGQESAMSVAVRGTSLAQPTISSVDHDTANGDTTVTVSWYMNNVDAYQQDIRYEVNCYADNSCSKVIETQSVSGATSTDCNATFTGLKPNTNYYYSVEAYLTSIQNDTETSDIVDEATARRLVPAAPVNCTASAGTSKTEIDVIFTLPNKVDISAGNGTYTENALYFKIYRRLHVDSGTEKSWELITSYFGYDSTNANYNAAHPFASTEAPTVQLTNYIPGTTVIWKDTSLNARGIRYDYKVQGYTDETTRIISSDSSSSTAIGWEMATLGFKTNGFKSTLKNTSESSGSGNPYINASVQFTATRDMYGTDSSYAFILSETRMKFSEDNGNTEDTTGTTVFTSFDSLASINSYVRSFDLTTPINSRGYYTYILYVVPAGETTIDKQVDFTAAVGKLLVTDDSTLPSFADFGFSVEGGHSNKLILSWKYNSTFTYAISYQTCDATGAATSTESTSLSEEVITNLLSSATDGSTVTLNDSVPSGESRLYTFTANRVVDVTGTNFGSTLGTPKVNFNISEKSYNAITVTWDDVQKANGYTIQLSDEAVITLSEGTTENYSVTDGVHSYTYNQPAGYNDATKAGNALTVKVCATNTTTNETTIGTVNTCTLGPAAMAPTATQSMSYNSITVTWQSIDGAAAYAVERLQYNIPSSGSATVQKETLFTITPSCTVTANSGTVTGTTVTRTGAKYTLVDTYKPYSGSEDGLQIAQSRIAWGVPFDYIIVPLASETDSFDYSTGSIGSNVTYANIAKIAKRGSTVGYGQNVSATKSEYASKVILNWNAPCMSSVIDLTPIVYRKPSLDSTSAWKKYDASLNKDKTSYTVEAENDYDYIPYDYAISYQLSTSTPTTLFVPSYEAELTSTLDATYSPTEQLNKGYFFALEPLVARNEGTTKTSNTEEAETYSEKVTWTLWDYTKRAVGPADNGSTPTYTIYEKNYNNSSKWFPVAAVSKDGSTKSTLPNYESWYNTSLSISGSTLTLTPSIFVNATNSTTGIDDGLLKVQRDYLHYYKITALRQDSSSSWITTAMGDNNTVSTYRKISGDEFVSNVLLIFADAINQSGVASKGSRTVSGNIGAFTITHTEATKTLIFGTGGNSYNHKFYSLPGKQNETFVSAWTISIPTSEYRAAVDDSKVYYFGASTITVSHNGISSYEGSLTFSAGTQGKLAKLIVAFDGVSGPTYNLTCSATGKTIANPSISDNESTFKQYFPFTLGSDHDTKYTTYNSDLPSYNGTWWEVR